jgi:hypothetical protein
MPVSQRHWLALSTMKSNHRIASIRRHLGTRRALLWLGAALLLLLLVAAYQWWLPLARSTGQSLGLLPSPTLPLPSPLPTRPLAQNTPRPTEEILFPTVTPRSTLLPPDASQDSPAQQMTLTAVMALEMTAVAELASPTLAPPTLAPPTQPLALPTIPTVPTLIAPTVPPQPTVAPAPTTPRLSTASSIPTSSIPTISVPTAPTMSIPTIPPNVPIANPSIPLAAPSLNNCQPDSNSHAVPNYPVRIYTVNKQTEVFLLENVSGSPVDIRGWIMCSIKDNQQYQIGSDSSVTLEPGQMRGFVFRGAAIWDNDKPDDGALYNAQGQLVSYWSDPNLPVPTTGK